ncbi:MAG TPA: Do family serine endopeptidase [Xanthomonadales bacterium]|nr:Do family serine endopeptidase [Xanthomonadales bacterium]
MFKKLISSTLLVLFIASAQTGSAAVTGLPDFTGLVREAGPAVVNIQVTQFGDRVRAGERDAAPDDSSPYSQEELPELFRRFFGQPNTPDLNEPDRFGAGSGFIIESDGYIITNHHVIDGADEIIVSLEDRREFIAELVGSDPQSDIALLKIDEEGLPFLRLGDSNNLQTGEWVAAIGSPFGFEQTVTAGIVSAKGRSNNSQQYVPFIQTDVAINRGNSGGPLLNMDGEVVGINSWILSGSGGYMGLSFSIPIETAANSIQQLRTTGKVTRGLLGVVVAEVSREYAEAMNLDRSVGALVTDLNRGGAADRAGIEPGDVILRFNDRPINEWSDLPPLVGANPPGTEVDVVVARNGDERVFEVTLDALESDNEGNLQTSTAEETQSNALGIAVQPVPADRMEEFEGVDGGVIVVDVESDEAYRAGLRRGDVLLAINNQSIEGVEDFEDVVESLPDDKAVALRIMRNGNSNFIAFTPEISEDSD